MKVSLSVDGGETFTYEMLLENRESVSYPDVDQDEAGNIYIVYDRERDNRAHLNTDTWVSEAAKEILPHVEMKEIRDMSTGSTDMGDLSRIMPTVQPYAGGATGTFHGNNFYITDPERAAVDAAKWQLAMAKLLFENGAALAKQAIAEFKPEFPSKEAYLAYMDALNTSGKRISALDDTTLTVKI
jgi:hypothetical protein